jgi:uncharacterized protein
MSACSRWLVSVASLCLAASLMGCGPNYAAKVEHMRVNIDRGDLNGAISDVNGALGVDLAAQMPSDDQDQLIPLLLLERAALLQATQQFSLSARDFQAADARIEVLDLSESSADDIAQYLFSDAMGDYKTPPYEKLLLNTMNMLNYLALADLSGAKVEARRVEVLERYFKDYTSDKPDVALGLAAYLSGFVYEKMGQPDDALRWYDTATRFGSFPGIGDVISYLMQQRPLSNDRLQAIAAQHPNALPLSEGEGEVLVVIASGVAPRREAKRVPIGLALTLAARDNTWRRSDRYKRAQRLEAEGLFKWVNYPALEGGFHSFTSAQVLVGERSVPAAMVLDVGAQAIRYFDSIEGKLALASITRLLTRSVASAATEAAIKGSGKRGDSGTALVGFLVGKAVEGAMTVADTPDTRSWNSLPSAFWIVRVRVPHGKHKIVLQTNRGGSAQVEVNLRPQQPWAVVVLRSL